MGLALRLNLFYGVSHQQVYRAYTRFYAGHNQHFVDEGDEYLQFNLHEQSNNWTALDLDGGWEWKRRRAAQLFVSAQLQCAGFLIFVNDGDYWGYEFFQNGVALDQFIQDSEAAQSDTWFPDLPCTGNPQTLADTFPHLTPSDIAPYLMQNRMWENWDEVCEEQLKTEWEQRWGLHDTMNNPARQGDEFCRFDECAVLDFLRLLGVQVQLLPSPDLPSVRCVTFMAPLYRAFWISEQNTGFKHRKMYRKTD